MKMPRDIRDLFEVAKLHKTGDKEIASVTLINQAVIATLGWVLDEPPQDERTAKIYRHYADVVQKYRALQGNQK